MNNACTIYTKRGQAIMVDAADFEALSAHRWCVSVNGYAVRKVPGEKGLIFMHRELLGLKKGDGRLVDHANHDPLDNRRANLRLATQAQNQRNRRVRCDSSTGVKGVYKARDYNGWKAYIVHDHRKINLGSFPSLAQAAECRKLAADMLQGEFARHV